MTTHASGSPNWFELATTDQAGAERFYTGLFGWTAQRVPMGDGGGDYTLFHLGDREVAAAYTLPAEQAAPPNDRAVVEQPDRAARDGCDDETSAQAIGSSRARPDLRRTGDSKSDQDGRFSTSCWGVHFKVDDADAVAARAAATGGEVLASPFEVMDMLRMAVCADAERAAFSLFQPRTHDGVAAIREPNAISWAELATRDMARAEAFYTGLFGWTMHEHHASPASGYRMFGNDDGMLGGLLQMTEEWGEMPSHWSIYIQVEDVDAIVDKAQSLGGTLCFPAFDAPGVGRLARIDDPSGAGFYVIRYVEGV